MTTIATFFVLTVFLIWLVLGITIIVQHCRTISKKSAEQRLAERLQRDREITRQINFRLVVMERYWTNLFEQQLRNQQVHLDRFHARYVRYDFWADEDYNKSEKVCWQKEGF
jgi:hypothetical protein